MQNTRAAKCKFCFSQPWKQCFIRTIWLSRVRSAMECTGENFFRLQGRKTAPLKFGLFDQFFFIFTKGGCTCFNGNFQRKKTKPSHVQFGPITGRRLPWRFFGCSPRNQGCTCLSQFGHIFFWSMTKMHKIYPSATQPLFGLSPVIKKFYLLISISWSEFLIVYWDIHCKAKASPPSFKKKVTAWWAKPMSERTCLRFMLVPTYVIVKNLPKKTILATDTCESKTATKKKEKKNKQNKRTNK